MREKGIFFNEEQIELLKEINQLEEIEMLKKTTDRLDLFNRIVSKYSMLKKDKGIFHAQLFSAMEEYLETCNKL